MFNRFPDIVDINFKRKTLCRTFSRKSPINWCFCAVCALGWHKVFDDARVVCHCRWIFHVSIRRCAWKSCLESSGIYQTVQVASFGFAGLFLWNSPLSWTDHRPAIQRGLLYGATVVCATWPKGSEESADHEVHRNSLQMKRDDQRWSKMIKDDPFVSLVLLPSNIRAVFRCFQCQLLVVPRTERFGPGFGRHANVMERHPSSWRLFQMARALWNLSMSALSISSMS